MSVPALARRGLSRLSRIGIQGPPFVTRNLARRAASVVVTREGTVHGRPQRSAEVIGKNPR